MKFKQDPAERIAYASTPSALLVRLEKRVGAPFLSHTSPRILLECGPASGVVSKPERTRVDLRESAGTTEQG